MKAKKLILCTAVIFVMYVVMDFVFYYYIFPERFLSNALREEPLKLWVILGLLIASFMFPYLYSKMAKGTHKTQEGMKLGFALGVFMYMPLFLIFYGTRDTRPLAAWLTNAAFHVIQFMVFGIVVAHISGIPASAKSKSIEQMPA